MSFVDTLRELRRELRQRRGRALLSLTSMAWGTLSLLLLLAFSYGFEALFVERARGIGDAVAIAWPQRTTRAARGFPAGRRLELHRDDVQALAAAVPQMAAASSEFLLRERLRQGGRVQRVSIAGVEPVYGELRNLTPQPGGRFLSPIDTAERRRVIFLGDVLARALFGAQDPVGRSVVLRAIPFTVIGVLQQKQQDSDYNGQDKDRAFVPATTFTTVFGERPIDDFVYRAADPQRQQECARAVVAALAQRLAFDPADEAALQVWDTSESSRMLGYIFLGFHSMLGIAGAFTLVVGGLGIAQLMHLLVRARTAEIGLKLAVGAEPRTIGREWLLQALALVLTGSLAGVVLSVAAIALVRGSPLQNAVGQPFVPAWLATLVALLLAAIGFCAGWFPARAAARLDPVAALRGGA